MSSGPDKVRWTCICRGSTISGRPAVGTELNFGVASRRKASEARFASSASGPLADVGLKGPTRKTFEGFRSARTIARLMTVGRDLLTKAETVTVAVLEAGVPTLVEAREIIAEFHMMIRRKLEAGLSSWIERAGVSLVASFANGVVRDEVAVRAAITSPWSNGQTEGQITRLKLVRRQMYGRGKIDLLQARLIGAESANRLHELHPQPTASVQSRQRNRPTDRGSILDADPPAQGVNIAGRMTQRVMENHGEPCTKREPKSESAVLPLNYSPPNCQ